MRNLFRFSLFQALALFAIGTTHAATHFISDQMPAGTSLADVGLGERPFGHDHRAVRLVEWATLPGAGQIQQIVAHGDHLFFALKEGRVWRYGLAGQGTETLFLDVASLRPGAFQDSHGWAPSTGLRGFALHPDFENNGLVYTAHKEASSGANPDFGTEYILAEYVLAEWDFHEVTDGNPSFREIFRVAFEHDWHVAQHVGFNPHARAGDSDYGHLYACFGDNGAGTGGNTGWNIREVSDVSNVGQDFGTIHASVIRIDPTDPSGRSDSELLAAGLKRGKNGKYSLPLDNPFIGHPSFAEEIFSKGFRNPLTLSFNASGEPVVADVGEQTIEEINLLVSGGNYGWPVREGTFIVPFANQTDGEPLGADASMQWMPAGDDEDPAVTFYVRDKDGTNLRSETLARSGPHADGLAYPVFQFTHEGNNTNGELNGLAGVAGGDVYSGFWAKELEGLYLFGNISTDALYFGAANKLSHGQENAEVKRLPLVDKAGEPVTLASIVGSARANMRFGRDTYGDLYLASKANGKVYRFQGTPDLRLSVAGFASEGPGEARYIEIALVRPPADASIAYELQVAENLAGGFSPVPEVDYQASSPVPLDNGMEKVVFRYLKPVDSESARFFRFAWTHRE